MSKKLRTFFEIRNVDSADGEMYLEGVSDTGLPNRRGMLLDYASSKPYIEAFVKEFEERTAGESKGPLRIMHSEITSAGKIVNLDLVDADCTIPVRVHVVDDEAKTKVEAKVLNAFSWYWRSVGAPWEDKELTAKEGRKILRFTGKPVELSLVDSPGVPGTGFTIENADFGEEEDEMDEPTNTDPAKDDAASTDVKNGVYTAGRLMSLVEDLHYLQKSIASEESSEGDSNEIPKELLEAVQLFAPIAAKYATKQIAELVGMDEDEMFVGDDDEFEDIENADDADVDDVMNADVVNGDFPGHPFRGNQYKSGKGGKGGKHHQASLAAHRASVGASRGKVSHTAAAKSHRAAASLHASKGNKAMEAHHKQQAKFHAGEAKLRKQAKSFQNADGGDDPNVVKNADGTNPNQPDVSQDPASILADLAKSAAPNADVKNADASKHGTVVTKDQDNGVDVKNADAIRKEAERIAALPEGERAAAVAAKIIQGAIR